MAVGDKAEETPRETPEDAPLAKAMRFVWGPEEFQVTPPPAGTEVTSDGDAAAVDR
jgi:hypothetical protein